MSFLRHRDTRRAQRHADRLTPVPSDQVSGVMSLCALEPVCAVSLVQQMQRWNRWGRGDVVALGGLAQPVAAAWSVGSLMPFGLAGRPEHGLRAADAGEIRALAEHCRPRLSRHGSVCGPARDVEAIWGTLSEQGVRSRQERWKQPVLVAPRPAGGLSVGHRPRHSSLSWVGQAVRRAHPSETEMVLPASVDMFIGELGYDPTTDGPGYRRHVGWLVEQGRSYVVLDGQELHSTTLERDVAVDLVHRVRAAGRRQLVLTVSGKRCAYVECADEAFLAECRKYYSRLEILPDLLDFDDEVLKLALFDPESVTRFAEPLIADLAGSHHAATSGRYWLDIAAKGTNKGAALRRLQDRLAVPPEQTAAFGDYLNDLDLYEHADLGFAMSNAHPGIRAAAAFTAPANTEDGVLRMVEELLRRSRRRD